MFGKHLIKSVSSYFVILVFLLVTSCKIQQTLSDEACDEKIQCEGDVIVMPKHIQEMQINCTQEWELGEYNKTCSIQCMFGQLNLLDDKGKPSLNAFQNFVNSDMCVSLREDARKCDCFRFISYFDNLSAEKTTERVNCENTKLFDACMHNFFGNICKEVHE